MAIVITGTSTATLTVNTTTPYLVANGSVIHPGTYFTGIQ